MLTGHRFGTSPARCAGLHAPHSGGCLSCPSRVEEPHRPHGMGRVCVLPLLRSHQISRDHKPMRSLQVVLYGEPEDGNPPCGGVSLIS